MEKSTVQISAPNRRAVIDIGTNSVKLLVADVTGLDIIPIDEQSKQTRLGRGFYETHLLQPDAIAATAEAVQNFSTLAKNFGAKDIRVLATSAARDANNAQELLGAIESSSGLRVRIISGEQEADWAFHGVSGDPKFSEKPLLIIDVGGGSTEFILGKGNQQYFRNSYRLGTVRLLEQLRPGDPPGIDALESCRAFLKEFLQREIAPELGPKLSAQKEVQLVGTGGTTTILARMEKQLMTFERAEIENARLSLAQVRSHVERHWTTSLDERKKFIGLPPNRADVVLFGIAIFEAVMNCFEFRELCVSMRGLRFAAIAEKNF
jgi:exopolyphosphatase/guanosine-5'-triphosphate,3'-diphosphate pyrophosphatase